MKTPADARFVEQARRFRLRLFCEDCVHFEPQRRRCAAGYPNQEHLRKPLEQAGVVVFCKSFELA